MADEKKLENIKTGDVIISAFNSGLGYVVRVFTNCEFNHICIAIRIDPIFLPRVKIVKTGGLLCVLENKITSLYKDGKYYHLILRVLPTYEHYKFIYRPLKPELYTKGFCQRMINYIYSNSIEFLDNDKKINIITDVIGHSSDIVPHSLRTNIHFLAWITSNCCSELTYSFYEYCLDGKIKSTRSFYVPKHFTTPNFNDIFNDQILLIDKSNTLMAMLNDNTFIIIILLIIFLIIYFVYFLIKKYRMVK